MARARLKLDLLAGCLLVWGSAVVRADNVTDILGYHPRQPGVNCTVPTPEEEKTCKAELVKLADKGMAYLLRDSKGQLLRRFADTNGDNKLDVWSFYKDGVEVYRELDSDFNGKRDQYRWLNSGGMKWGIDQNEDGKIDVWRMISAEEVCQEIVQALATHDVTRLQTLLLSDAEIETLKLSATEAARIRDQRARLAAKFQDTVNKLPNLSAKTHILNMELGAPNCVPAEQIGGKYDLIKHPNVTILCETDGKNDWIQTGEIIQVGLAWRITEAPGMGMDTGNKGGPPEPELTAEEKALMDQLAALDKRQPAGGPELVQWHLQRVDVLEKLVAKCRPEAREAHYREEADSLSTAAQIGSATDKTAFNRLVSLEEQLVKVLPPGSNLAAYVTFREIMADSTIKLADGKEYIKVIPEVIERLTKFVQTYPKAEDLPEVLHQLGTNNELLGNEVPAKNWYQQLVRDFPESRAAAHAQGALKRLEVEGKTFELTGPLLSNGTAFDVARLRGKVVVVYYWSRDSQAVLGDFAKLKMLLEENSTKGLELVSINLDSNADEVRSFVQRAQAPGTHLFQPGDPATGQESPLAQQYGIEVLPQMFLIARDGKVVSRNIQIGKLAAELQKLLK